MDALKRFGRTARFDYLTMVGKLGLANIAPGSPYMVGATGPLKGAALLFRVAGPLTKLDDLTRLLGNHLGSGDAGDGGLPLQLAKEPRKVQTFSRLASIRPM